MELAAALTASPSPGISAALSNSSPACVGPGFAQLFQRESVFQKVRMFLSGKGSSSSYGSHCRMFVFCIVSNMCSIRERV